MARKLMKLILGDEILKKSSPTGRNGLEAIPENIYEAVEQFVNDNVAKKNCISPQQFRQTMTMMCATLRNPKPSTARDTQKDTQMSNKNNRDLPEIKNSEESEIADLNSN